MVQGSWVLHVGWQKTGSTWLQKSVFPRLPDVEFIGKRYPMRAEDWSLQLFNTIHFVDDLEFSADRIAEVVRAHTAHVPLSKVRVLSGEGLVGNPWHAGFDSKRNADRLQAIFGPAKILFTVRNQGDMLESLYKQYLLEGGTCRFETLLSTRSQHADFRMEHLQYPRLIRYYESLFGADQVRVIPYELLVNEPQQFVDLICEFIGVDRWTLNESQRGYVRRGFSPNLCRYMRYINYVAKSNFNPAGFFGQRPSANWPRVKQALHPYTWATTIADWEERLGRRRELLAPEQRHRIQDYYRAGNQQLQPYVPYDLGAFGYPM